MSYFDDAFDFTIGIEGKYSNDPNDIGGETNWGISKRQYPNLDIKNLTKETAKKIYQKDYWNSSYDLLDSKDLAIRVFDMSVNSGENDAIKNLQKAINYCGWGIAIDGKIGAITVDKANSVKAEWLLERFRTERSKFYCDEVTRKQSQLKYLKGWILRNYK